jgi:hypothetical protein
MTFPRRNCRGLIKATYSRRSFSRSSSYFRGVTAAASFERGAPFTTAGFARMVECASEAACLGFKAHPHMLRHACGFALTNKGTTQGHCRPYLVIGISSTRYATPSCRRIDLGTSGGACGEKRDVVTAARLKEMGVMPGFPDLLFFGPHGEVCFAELKAQGGRLNEALAAVASHLIRVGHVICAPRRSTMWSRP